MKPLLIAVLLLAFVAPQAYADDPQDPETFLRRARVLATVERDVGELRAVVDRTVAKHGGDAEWLSAFLEVAGLLEQQGQHSQALGVFVTVTDKHAKELSEKQKKDIHEAMLRLLPEGVSTRTPLGTIYKIAGPVPAARRSPLEEKIRDLFQKLTVASVQDQNPINRAKQQIVWALRDAGPEVFPVLGAIVLDG